jgi:hypothetical protein
MVYSLVNTDYVWGGKDPKQMAVLIVQEFFVMFKWKYPENPTVIDTLKSWGMEYDDTVSGKLIHDSFFYERMD